MLNQRRYVVWKGAKGSITTLLLVSRVRVIGNLVRALKPWMKTSNSTFRILSHALGAQEELELECRCR
jgi:hypothetical protein